MAVAAAVLVIGLAIWVSVERKQRWLLEDGERVAEIDRLRLVAHEAAGRANEFSRQAAGHQAEAKKLQVELDRVRKWIKNRPAPKTLVACQKQLKEFDAAAAILERSLALEKLTVYALSGQIAEVDRRAENLESAWKKERKRADGFQKIRKRDKMKKVFIGVGSGLAGGAIVGLAVGATN